MSNTITSIAQRLPAQNDLLGKANKTNKNEFANVVAKTRDRGDVTTQDTADKAPNVAPAPAQTKDVTPTPLPALKVDAEAKPDDVVAKDLTTTGQASALIAPAPPQNDDVLSWLGMPGLKTITLEKKTLTATFGDGQTTPPATTPAIKPTATSFANLKDLMSWFFGDMSMDLPVKPTPAPTPAPVPTPTPTPTPPPTPPGNGAPGIFMTWDGGKVTPSNPATEPAPKTTTPTPAPALAVDDAPAAFGWKDLMSIAFTSAKATLEQRDNAFTLQMEMRKMNALFGRQNEASDRAGVVA